MICCTGYPEEFSRGPGRDDQLVVAEYRPVLEHDAPLVEVHLSHLPVTERHVFALPEDRAHRICDVRYVETRGGQLVEQRLERVEIVPVDDRDFDAVTR